MPEALDLLKIAALRLQSMQIPQWSYWLDPPQERLEWLEEGFRESQFTFIYQKNQLIAMFRLMEEDLKYWGKQQESAYYVHSLVVHPLLKRKKLGAQLIELIYQKAIDHKKSFLRLDCDATNYVLCNYYEMLGFSSVGSIEMSLSKNRLFEKKVVQ